MILKSLQHHDGNVTRVAESLGLSRAALSRQFENPGSPSETRPDAAPLVVPCRLPGPRSPPVRGPRGVPVPGQPALAPRRGGGARRVPAPSGVDSHPRPPLAGGDREPLGVVPEGTRLRNAPEPHGPVGSRRARRRVRRDGRGPRGDRADPAGGAPSTSSTAVLERLAVRRRDARFREARLARRNPSAARMLGARPEDLRGRRLAELPSAFSRVSLPRWPPPRRASSHSRGAGAVKEFQSRRVPRSRLAARDSSSSRSSRRSCGNREGRVREAHPDDVRRTRSTTRSAPRARSSSPVSPTPASSARRTGRTSWTPSKSSSPQDGAAELVRPELCGRRAPAGPPAGAL